MSTDSQLLDGNSSASLTQHPFSGESRACNEYQGRPDAEGRKQELVCVERDLIGKSIALIEEDEAEEAEEVRDEESREIMATVSNGEREPQHRGKRLVQVLNDCNKSQDYVIQEILANTTTDRISYDGNNGKSYNQAQEPVFSPQLRSCIKENKNGEQICAQDCANSIGEEREFMESPRSQSFHHPDAIHSLKQTLIQPSELQISNSKRASFRGASDYFINLWTTTIKRPSIYHLHEPDIGKGEEGSVVNRNSASNKVKENEHDEISNAHCQSNKKIFSTIKKGLSSTRNTIKINNNDDNDISSCLDQHPPHSNTILSPETQHFSSFSSSSSSPLSPTFPRCHHRTGKDSNVNSIILDQKDKITELSAPLTNRLKNRISKSPSQHTYNTFGSTNSQRQSFSSGYRNSNGLLIGKESTRTWCGLFSSVRELSHPTSTTGSSTHSLSSSSSSSSSTKSIPVGGKETRYQRQQKKLSTKKQKIRKPIPIPSPKMNQSEDHQINEKPEPCRLSIVVVGDGAVGKSALTLRFLRDQFHDEYDPTIEDSYCRHIEVDGVEYTLDINDTAGQHEYRGNWNDRFMRSGDGFICVYSVAAIGSFQELVGFRDQIWRSKETKRTPIIVVGNKWDLADQGHREVPTDLGARFAEDSNALFVEASAKIGMNINELFIALVRDIVRQKKRESYGYPDLEYGSHRSIDMSSVPVKGYSKNATPPVPIGGMELDVQKSYRCCTIM